MADNQLIGRELDSLRGVRDEIALQIHLGSMEAQDAWKDLEDRFRGLERRLKGTAESADASVEDARSRIDVKIDELRQEYDRLRAEISSGVEGEQLGERVRQTFADAARVGQDTTRRAVASLRSLSDAGRARVHRARVERDLSKRYAKLGKRVYEISRTSKSGDVDPLSVFADEEVAALVDQIGALDSALLELARETSGAEQAPAPPPNS